jgi:outer membrane protein assembly factor BamB
MKKLAPLCCGLLLALAGSLCAAEQPRYGAADFKPTPQQPIGFQADGNGWYPGATPAVVEWWDGKPGWGKVVTRGSEGNQSPPFDESSYKEVELRVFTDNLPKNILWKVPTPGHSDAQPVVVGNRIIGTYYPHFVVCYDIQTGKELWRDTLEMAFLPELQADRRTLGPVPDPKEAGKMQTLFEIAQAMAHLTQNLRDFEGEDPGPAEYPLVKQAIARMNEWRKNLAEAHPPSVALLDEEIKLAERFLAGEHTILGAGQKKLLDDREVDKKIPQFGDPWGRRKNLVGATARLLKAPIVGTWPGWMPYHASAPCSDGEIVIVRFCHGQLGAYEVATGKRLWAWRDTEAQLGWTWHVTSPRIKGDVVYLDLIHKRTNKHAAEAGPGMLALDKRTGAVRWFSPEPQPAGGYPICTPVFVDVPEPDGKVRPVLVNWEGAIIDAATGKRLGSLPERCLIYESHPLVMGDRIISPHGIGGTRLSSLDLRLRGDGQGGVTVSTNSVIPFASYRGAWVRNEQLIMPQGYDFRTGYSAGGAGVGGEHTGPSILGPLFVDVVNKYDGSGCDYKYRPRRDGVNLGVCVVAEAEVRPHDAPRVLSDRNLLGGAEAPADYFFDKHLAGFDKMRQINPKKHCGRYGNLITAYFGHFMSGPVASGNRLFIQSQCYLYGIGPAVQGTPADDPAIVAAIRAGQDIEKHLASPSAQYRYEAVKQAKGPADVLRRLIAEDPYEEIRLAAVAALDAADPQGQAGWQALVKAEFEPAYGTDVPFGKPGYRDQVERRKTLPLLFRCLGPEAGKALIALRWPQAEKDPVQRRALIAICTALRWRVDPMYAAAMTSLANPKAAWPANYFVAVDAAAAAEATPSLLKAFPKTWEIYPTFARHLKTEQLLAWIEPFALESAHPLHRGRILTAWKTIGQPALPSMERVKTAMLAKVAADKLAAEYAKVIEETITALKEE